MSVKFTHYLITRFNVPVKNWEQDKAGLPVLDDAWMKNRLVLFRKYCVPTLAQQAEKNFTWLIYCDRLTTTHFLAEIRKAIEVVPEAAIRQVDDFDGLLLDLKQLISSVPTPYVITSRLDNDDGLGPQFIAKVQESFEPKDKLIINLTKGVLYDVHRCVLTEIRNSQVNHYGSLIEETAHGPNFLTVFGYPHGRPPAACTIKNVDSRFSWLKIIHLRNMVSRTNGKPLVSSKITAHFNLQPDDFSQSWLATSIFVIRRLLYKIKIKIFPPG